MDNSIVYIIIIALIVFVLFKFIPYIVTYFKGLQIKSKLKKANIKDIDKMNGLDFEIYLSVLFKELGYKAVVTNGSHDFGADLILKKGKHKIVVQAKRYGYKKNVSIGAIQEVFASQRYHNADESWVITNSFFTKSALKLAKPCNVILKNRYDLVDWILKIQPNTSPEAIRKENVSNRSCPNCDHALKIRTSKAGNQFIGCSNYPTCKYTENL
ncbi:restriction endonuclease [Staphylococcus xylosus]|uniref:Restriction endonuclease n=1 Tax=Staphylococcus xylosus TaxID=1288 RepID=A0AAQ0RWM2_STAXY|nr:MULTISPECIES: restriction endonuclease [Staphylococcus]RIL88694.1 restriction endonuclease [Staphylococcus cohnii]RIM64079.1 restriction endonuclease [Staphylococcus xylosus]RIM90666.1 restriction endonuclease [Staphylococcus xylosus]